MNPQQIQQVRQISQEQLKPFQTQHSIAIDKLKEEVANLQKGDNIDNPNQYKEIIKNQQVENDHLKKLISQQKEELTAIADNISQQVNKHLEVVNKNIADEILPIRAVTNSLVIKLDKININNAIREYYDKIEERLDKEIDSNNKKIKDNEIKEKEYIDVNGSISELEEYIAGNTLTSRIKNVLDNQIEELKGKKNKLNIEDIRNQIEEYKKQDTILKTRKEKAIQLNM